MLAADEYRLATMYKLRDRYVLMYKLRDRHVLRSPEISPNSLTAHCFTDRVPPSPIHTCVEFEFHSDGRGLDQSSLKAMCAEVSGLVGLSESALLVAALDSGLDGRVTLQDLIQVGG